MNTEWKIPIMVSTSRYPGEPFGQSEKALVKKHTLFDIKSQRTDYLWYEAGHTAALKHI